jgi:hypothetical protein
MAAEIARREALSEFLARIDARKVTLGITPAATAAARNNGTRRTAEKRAQLLRIQARARDAGLAPLPARF